MLLPRTDRPAVAVIDGRIYVAGGYSRIAGIGVRTASAEMFDPATGAWTLLPQLDVAGA